MIAQDSYECRCHNLERILPFSVYSVYRDVHEIRGMQYDLCFSSNSYYNLPFVANFWLANAFSYLQNMFVYIKLCVWA